MWWLWLKKRIGRERRELSQELKAEIKIITGGGGGVSGLGKQQELGCNKLSTERPHSEDRDAGGRENNMMDFVVKMSPKQTLLQKEGCVCLC